MLHNIVRNKLGYMCH